MRLVNDRFETQFGQMCLSFWLLLDRLAERVISEGDLTVAGQVELAFIFGGTSCIFCLENGLLDFEVVKQPF